MSFPGKTQGEKVNKNTHLQPSHVFEFEMNPTLQEKIK